jgi:hypothetical protein
MHILDVTPVRAISRIQKAERFPNRSLIASTAFSDNEARDDASSVARELKR